MKTRGTRAASSLPNAFLEAKDMRIDQEISPIGRNSISCKTKRYGSVPQCFHWHEKYEICQLINKPCRFLVDGMLIHAEPGDVVAFKERSIHSFLVGHEDTDVRILQFPIKILLTAGVFITPLRQHIPRKDMEKIPGLSEKVNTLFSLLEDEYYNNTNRENPYSCSLSASLYFLLMQHFAIEEGQNTITKERQEFYKIVEYINEHFAEDIRINSLSEILFIPRGRLSAIFTKYSGTGLNEYVNSLRVKHANDLLKQGYTVTEAALESGFQSIRTFNSVYKKTTGITPSDFARK